MTRIDSASIGLYDEFAAHTVDIILTPETEAIIRTLLAADRAERERQVRAGPGNILFM